MAELYHGIAGSPITYLAADISANQTTISIADDSALPDAPNIATIGYGEQLETIKYGIKSNGVLQEVVRGVEGIPRAWQAGTEVARFFTAYDHNSIIEGFIAHKAESVYEKLEIARDMSITGTYTVLLQQQRVPKRVSVIGGVPSTEKYSVSNGTGCIYNIPSVGIRIEGNVQCVVADTGVNRTFVVFENFDVGKLDLRTVHSGSGATGTASIIVIVHYHD